MNTEEYKAKMGEKIAVLQRINENLLSQYEAINSKEIAILGKLAKRQQKNIDRLNRINGILREVKDFDRTSDLRQYETDTDSLLKAAIQANKMNISAAEELKNASGRELYRLRINGKAIKNGYFNMDSQQNGYFIDKRK
ncbi:MAG TPA: hypothetical protein VN580_03065 [Clostridia bacterium]|nr:hypothetical protein [Clostridia bacterium]